MEFPPPLIACEDERRMKTMEKNSDSHQRTAILVDTSNLYKSAKRKKAKIDYKKLLGRLNGRPIVRSVLYQAEAGSDGERSFFRKMRSLGFEIRTRKLRILRKKRTEGNMDLDIAMDAVSLSDKVDVIVLASGDGDFVPLVHYLKAKGVRVEAMAFWGSTSSALRKAVDAFTPISKDLLFEPTPEPSTE
jgi:uncharacterized LabA/DUF88 family protein